MSNKKHHVSAVIYDKRGRVLSVGFNSYIKTHPMQAKFAKKCGLSEKQYLHAEIHAITRCPELKNAYKIFVSRWGKHGEPLLAKPCPICKSAIEAAGIKIIEHT